MIIVNSVIQVCFHIVGTYVYYFVFDDIAKYESTDRRTSSAKLLFSVCSVLVSASDVVIFFLILSTTVFYTIKLIFCKCFTGGKRDSKNTKSPIISTFRTRSTGNTFSKSIPNISSSSAATAYVSSAKTKTMATVTSIAHTKVKNTFVEKLRSNEYLKSVSPSDPHWNLVERLMNKTWLFNSEIGRDATKKT